MTDLIEDQALVSLSGTSPAESIRDEKIKRMKAAGYKRSRVPEFPAERKDCTLFRPGCFTPRSVKPDCARLSKDTIDYFGRTRDPGALC